MKYLNLFFFLLFISSAVLQYNDPDPWLWIPIYLFAAFTCWQAFRKKFYPKLYIIAIIAFSALAVYLFFTRDGVLDWVQQHRAESLVQSMKATKPWIEATREFLGLILVIVALILCRMQSVRT